VDNFTDEAITGLEATFRSFLPAPVSEALKPVVFVNPLRVAPAGVGGFVAASQEPQGDILGLRLDAQVSVTVKADSADNLNGAVSTMTRTLLGADQDALIKQGILRIALEGMAPNPVAQPGVDPAAPARRDLTFRVLYEFLQKPRAGQSVIQQIQTDIDVDKPGVVAQVILSAEFMEGSLDWFEVADDPAATRKQPSQWAYNAPEFRIEQQSSIWNGTISVSPNNAGTYLVLRTAPGRPPLQNFTLKTSLRSDDTHGIGVVFRWQDADNFYYFLMDNQRGFRLLAKKVAGTFQRLTQGGLDAAASYEPGKIYNLKLTCDGPAFRVSLDGNPVLQGEDSSLPSPGRVGFICHRNTNSFFYNLSLLQN
jgi:hypothetical protein